MATRWILLASFLVIGVPLSLAVMHGGGVRKSKLLSNLENRFPIASTLLNLASPRKRLEVFKASEASTARRVEEWTKWSTLALLVVFWGLVVYIVSTSG